MEEDYPRGEEMTNESELSDYLLANFERGVEGKLKHLAGSAERVNVLEAVQALSILMPLPILPHKIIESLKREAEKGDD